ncbi:14996_t:CDS:2, partial [Funneliformis mosseae]
DDAKGIDQSSVNTISIKMKNSNDTPASNISDNISNEKDSRSFTSLIHISSEEKEINEFMELQEKERVSNMARERNREKKICRGRQIVQKTSSSSDTQNVISTEINPVVEITHEHKTTKSESMPTDQAQNTGIKIPYNKRVEQDLRRDLSVFIKKNNNKVSEVFDIQIPEFSLEVIITGSSKITAQNIADIFVIAMKVRQKRFYAAEVSIPIVPIPLAHDSVPEGPSNSSDNSKKEAWFDEDMFFNEANPSKVNTVTSDDDV